MHCLLNQIDEEEAAAEEQFGQTEAAQNWQLTVELMSLNAVAYLRRQVQKRREQKHSTAETK